MFEMPRTHLLGNHKKETTSLVRVQYAVLSLSNVLAYFHVRLFRSKVFLKHSKLRWRLKMPPAHERRRLFKVVGQYDCSISAITIFSIWLFNLGLDLLFTSRHISGKKGLFGAFIQWFQ